MPDRSLSPEEAVAVQLKALQRNDHPWYRHLCAANFNLISSPALLRAQGTRPSVRFIVHNELQHDSSVFVQAKSWHPDHV